MELVPSDMGEEGEGVQLLHAISAGLPEEPEKRARERLTRLRHTFAASLALVADMYQDRDWEYLVREDGTRYSSLVEVFVDVLDVSLAMARRYVQGAREFYLPLSLVVDGEAIQITSGEVASLGTSGMRDAVEIATTRLSGDDADHLDPGEVIEGAIKEAKERKSAPARETAEQRDWDSDADADLSGFDGAAMRSEAAADDFSDLPAAAAFEDDDEAVVEAMTGGESPLAALLADADPRDALASLPEPAHAVVEAMIVLSEADPAEVAAQIDGDALGSLESADGAIRVIHKIRALVETSPAFLALLG